MKVVQFNSNATCCAVGKHVALQAPKNAGSDFYNYKGFHSVVLMAMCDAKYRLTIVDIGAAGRESDGGVFSRSPFGQMFISEQLGIPECANLPGTDVTVPFVAVADAAFPLRTNLMKPYGGKKLSAEQQIFNYRLSRCRRCIENTFGIMAARWRILRRSMVCNPERAVSYVKAICVLHNYLQLQDDERPAGQRLYCPPGYVDTHNLDGSIIPGQWRSDNDGNAFLQRPLTTVPSNRYSTAAANVRQSFTSYFVSNEGAVSWQNKAVFSTG